ncbi:unnamed protein product [Onchocerca ochengi]|uniref:Secreted protein n=1 Tax=Onchocerca ochengi TaxID=42157 RepID=A0A182EDY7_ONCOC|nr:unnamed protein product [Onchocerca ochengi]
MHITIIITGGSSSSSSSSEERSNARCFSSDNRNSRCDVSMLFSRTMFLPTLCRMMMLLLQLSTESQLEMLLLLTTIATTATATAACYCSCLFNTDARTPACTIAKAVSASDGATRTSSLPEGYSA